MIWIEATDFICEADNSYVNVMADSLFLQKRIKARCRASVRSKLVVNAFLPFFGFCFSGPLHAHFSGSSSMMKYVLEPNMQSIRT